jgi:DNA primase
MQNPSDEIKSRLDIVEIIREYLPLKPAGMNFRANCPFHREKTPSFMVSPEKQIWHCFGCGKGGDVFSFVMEMEGISFVEALRMLAPKAGVTLKKADPALSSQRNRLLDAIELAGRYYHKFLLENPQAEWARNYLKGRGLTTETIENWQIGCSPDSWDSLTKILLSKGFRENEIFLAGLSIKSDRQPSFYDRFRGRIMFPINDVNGNMVGFSARINPQKEEIEKMGKYINSPQSMVYDKSKIIFGLDKAKMAIKKEEFAVLVEGQMDVITAHQHGFTNVVASSGTALTAEQTALLKRYSKNIILAFDMDSAGDLAAERGINQALAAEMNIKVAALPEGKDPDEFIKQKSEDWTAVMANAKPMMQYYFDKAFAKMDMENFEDKDRAIKKVMPMLAKLENKIEQGHWLKKMSQMIEADEADLKEELVKAIDKNNANQTWAKKEEDRPEAPLKKASREEMISELLLALLIKYPSYIEYTAGRLGPSEFSGKLNQDIYKNLIIYYNKLIEVLASDGGDSELKIDYQNFKQFLEKAELGVADEEYFNINSQPRTCQLADNLGRLVVLADKDFFELSEEDARVEVVNLVNFVRKNYLNRRLKDITKIISHLENSASANDKNNGEIKALMEELKIVADEIREL